MRVRLVDQMCEHMCARPSGQSTRCLHVVIAQRLDVREQSAVTSQTGGDAGSRSHRLILPRFDGDRMVGRRAERTLLLSAHVWVAVRNAPVGSTISRWWLSANVAR